MFLFILAYFVLCRAYVAALQVSPGSTCANICLDNPESDPLNASSSSTTVADIACNDDDYQSSSTGIKFKNCLECLQTSTNVSGTENDVSWFLYNLRYSVDVCVYGFPNATKSVSSPCDIDYACQPLKTALETNSLDPEKATEFDYCDADGGKFSGTQVDACIQCFGSSSNQAYMANFITALKAGCQQRPEAGVLLGLSGSPFTDSLVNITSPPSNETASSGSDSPTAMTTGAIVGIAVGASLLFLGGTALFWVYYHKQKHLYGSEFDSQYDPRVGNKSISPPMVGGFNSIDTSDQSHFSDYELKAQQAYNNNADYYDSIEKEMQTRRPQYAFDSNKPGSGPSGALPTHPAYINRALSRNSSRDPSPQPPRPIKSNKPDSYALATYLSAGEDALKLPGPPPGPPPATLARGSSPQPSRGSIPRPLHGRTPSDSSVHSSTRMTALQPPPPPPPRQTKVPSISLPSVPRIRIPKKYSPPKIQIEGATPVAEQGEVLPIGLEISNPVIEHDRRFVENPFGAGRRANQPPGPPQVVEQKAVDRRPRAFIEEVPIHTGKSSMYG
ncbi:putative LPXTG-domain-containing protein [Seiridium cardinale]|uniref:LPXTG-domain-containing protein n=1 Tax=Seiridium cardinale TaxID=138064 RepID=A0ABR2X9L2_9PEZI